MPRRRLALAAVLLAAAGCVHRAAQAAAAPAEPPKPIVRFTPVESPDPKRLAHPHGKDGLCQVCHEQGAAGVKKDPIALCADCHDAGRMKHVFRVEAPPEAVGKVPLMPGRLIACHTCHDPHDVKAQRAGLRMRFTDLCLACHGRHEAKEPGGAAAAHGQH